LQDLAVDAFGAWGFVVGDAWHGGQTPAEKTRPRRLQSVNSDIIPCHRRLSAKSIIRPYGASMGRFKLNEPAAIHYLLAILFMLIKSVPDQRKDYNLVIPRSTV
jgi:hypothetical protein